MHTARQHPLRLLSYTTRYFWLLIIPLARSLYSLSFEFNAFRVWLKGAWLDILVLLSIIAFAWIRWMSVRFSFDDQKIILYRGVYFTSSDTVYYSNIATISITQNVLYRLLGASTVYIGTNSGKADRADLTVIMRRADADRLYEAIKGSRQKNLSCSILSNKLRLIVFSLFFSSALSGVVIILALLWETGRILDREVETRIILDTLTEAARRVSVFAPPIITIINILIIFAWSISFASNLLVFWGFVLTKCNDSIYVKSGGVTKNRHILQSDKINYIDLQQSFSSKVFNVSSLHINCAGYGSIGRHELSVVLPITTRKEINGTLKEVFPEYPHPKIELKSHPRSYLSFYILPAMMAVLPLFAFGVFYYFLPSWYAVAYPAFAISLIPALSLALCRTLSMLTTGVGFSDGYITMRYSRFYTFHTIIAPKYRVAKAVIRQSMFQRFGDRCTLIIYTCSEDGSKHKMLGLPLRQTLELLSENGFDLYYSEKPN